MTSLVRIAGTEARRGLAWAAAAWLALCALAFAASAQTESYPRNTKAPSIEGAGPRQDGQTLKASQGEWQGPPAQVGPTAVTVTQEWLRCDSSDVACVVAGGGSSYTLGEADVGQRIRYRETASCGAPQVCRDTVAQSAPTGVVLPDPSNEALPEISGVAEQGQLLSGTVGFWRSVARLAYAHQWLRCDADGGACVPIPFANSADYRVGAADEGRRLRLAVTARNSRPRDRTATSAATRVVPALPAAAPQAPPTRRRARLLSPFPRVTIAGVLVGSRVVLSEFSIRAPRGSLVRIRCRGRRCPVRSRRFRMRRRRARVRAFQRALRPGLLIVVRVTKRGYIGKYTRIRVRRRRVPARTDLCLRPGARRPSRCPRR